MGQDWKCKRIKLDIEIDEIYSRLDKPDIAIIEDAYMKSIEKHPSLINSRSQYVKYKIMKFKKELAQQYMLTKFGEG